MNFLLVNKAPNYQSHLRIGVYLICIFTQNHRQSTWMKLWVQWTPPYITIFVTTMGTKTQYRKKKSLWKGYKNFSKKELKTSKLKNASINIIKYAAKEIRSRINKNPISIAVATDNDDEISRTFWGCAKKVFRSGVTLN